VSEFAVAAVIYSLSIVTPAVLCL